jgi:hypothetical protein
VVRSFAEKESSSSPSASSQRSGDSFPLRCLEEEGFSSRGSSPRFPGAFSSFAVLNNQIIDYGRIRIASDVAGELLAYVRSCDPGEDCRRLPLETPEMSVARRERGGVRASPFSG